jgi:hypothetical protein
MKIVSVKPVGRNPVYDLSIATENYDEQHYVLKNGVVTHNTGIYYSANQIFIISKAQEKEGTDLAGWKFTINIEKSRFVREKAKLPFTVLYDSGIQKWSALFDLAIESGHIAKGSTMGWYNVVNRETGELIEPKRRAKDLGADEEFFEGLVKDADFNKFIERKYKLTIPGKIEDDGNDDII